MSPARLRLLCNVYPPFLFSGIRVESIAGDWSAARVRLSLRWYNRNFVGTAFGGSLFAMTDPFFMILVMQRLGRDYVVWDRAGEIDFVAPGRGTVRAELRVGAEDVETLRAAADVDGKAVHWFATEILDEQGALVARVRKQVYVRRKQVSRG